MRGVRHLAALALGEADAWARERRIPAALHQTATAHAAYEAREDLSIHAVIVTPDRP